MGAPMARNIAQAGHDVRAWNRTRSKAEPLAEHGVTVCDDAAGAAEGAEVVLTMLSDGDAVAGVADAIPAGAVWWQASTIGLEATGRLAERGGERFVDA